MPMIFTEQQKKKFDDFSVRYAEQYQNVYELATELLGAPADLKDNPGKYREFLDSFYIDGKPYREYLDGKQSAHLGKTEKDQNQLYMMNLLKDVADSGKAKTGLESGVVFRRDQGQVEAVFPGFPPQPERPSRGRRFLNALSRDHSYEQKMEEWKKECQAIEERIKAGKKIMDTRGMQNNSVQLQGVSSDFEKWAEKNMKGLGDAYQATIRGLTAALRSRDGAVLTAEIPDMSAPDFMEKMAKVNENTAGAQQKAIAKLTEASIKLRQDAEAEKDAEKKSQLLTASAHLAHVGMQMQSQLFKMNQMYDQAVKAKRENTSDVAKMSGKSYKDVFENPDIKPYTIDTTGLSALGSGSINTVYNYRENNKDYVVKYGAVHVKGGPFFTTEHEVFSKRLDHQDMGNMIPGVAEAALDPFDSPDLNFVNTTARDVAVSRVNHLFDFQVCVDTRFATDPKGNPLSVMEKAEGTTMASRVFVMGDMSQEELSQQKAALKNEVDADALRYKRTYESLKETFGEDHEETREQKLKWKTYAAKADSLSTDQFDLRLEDQNLISKVMNLSAMDIIVGHRDRHFGNYMIHKGADGKVDIRAIDNDTSFGMDANILRATMTKDSGGIYPFADVTFPYVTKELKDKVDEVSTDTMRGALSGLISEAQIDSACKRLDTLKEYFSQLEKDGKVVNGPFTEQQVKEIFDADMKRVPKKVGDFSRERSPFMLMAGEALAPARQAEIRQEAAQRTQDAKRVHIPVNEFLEKTKVESEKKKAAGLLRTKSLSEINKEKEIKKPVFGKEL